MKKMESHDSQDPAEYCGRYPAYRLYQFHYHSGGPVSKSEAKRGGAKRKWSGRKETGRRTSSLRKLCCLSILSALIPDCGLHSWRCPGSISWRGRDLHFRLRGFPPNSLLIRRCALTWDPDAGNCPALMLAQFNPVEVFEETRYDLGAPAFFHEVAGEPFSSALSIVLIVCTVIILQRDVLTQSARVRVQTKKTW